MTDGADAILKRYQRKIDLWRMWYAVFIVLHYGLGVTALAAPIAISTDALGSGEQGGDALLGFIAALAAGLVTFLRPADRAQGFHMAYAMMETAIDRFQVANGRDGATEKLIEDHEVAQAFVMGVQPAQLASRYEENRRDG